MLIKLDSSIENLVLAGNVSESAILSLENLASAIRSGNHALIAGRDLLERLSLHQDLSRSARTLYAKLQRRWTQQQGLEHLVHRNVLVIASGEPRLSVDGDTETIVLPLERFQSFSLLNESEIIVENTSDIKIYKVIFSAETNDARFHINYRVINGNGGATAGTYSELQAKSDRFLFCIVDTDKSHPTCVMGSTARNSLDADDERIFLSKVYTLDVHEVENLVPLAIFDAQSREQGQSQRAEKFLSVLRQFEEDGNYNALDYLDIKNGIKCKEVNCAASGPFAQYWKPILGVIERANEHCDTTQCWDEECDKEILPGWDGRRGLGSFMSATYQERTPVSEHLKSHWQSLARVMLDWCIANPPIRT